MFRTIDDGYLEILPVVSDAAELLYAGFELYLSRSSAFFEFPIPARAGFALDRSLFPLDCRLSHCVLQKASES